MDEDWLEREERRLANEEVLLQKYSDYISKEIKPLIPEPYHCAKGEICDPVKNCQMERNVKKIREAEYSIKIDSGITIAKSYCSVIGKCIGYNEFFHTSEVTAAEDRLIDIKKDNAIFYHYFYSAKSKSYEPPFNITNFHTGSELYLNDIPHFSPDEKVMIEVRSIPKQEDSVNFPTGFNINIYEANELGEYKNIEPAEIDPENPDKIISTFLSRNPACGETPHFHSWKSNREVRLSMQPPSEDNEEGKKVILAYDKKSKKWSCHEDSSPEVKCLSYLPGSTKFSSNLAIEQINDCQ
ncbi:MAG: hypothetical protein K0R25_137 [Rickettsiaceae bacterium]|nr:hypothetical protein [Rickettsiaceae bacterium]